MGYPLKRDIENDENTEILKKVKTLFLKNG